MLRSKGFTLIEVIIFIVIMGVLGVGVLASFNVAMQRAPSIQNSSRAIGLAKRRMEMVMGYVDVYGFNNLTIDPCLGTYAGAYFCADPVGYTTTATIIDDFSGDANLKQVSVNVTGNATASLSSLVGNY